jgi:ribosomal protein L11 methyltransferase
MSKTHKISLLTTKALVAPFEEALQSFASIVTSFETSMDSDDWHIEGYSPAPFDKQQVEIALTLHATALDIPCPAFTLEIVDEQDWVAENQKNFPPLLAGRVFIHGSHYTQPVPCNKIGLEIDAATAFGTGDHPTTHGCLLALQYLHKRIRVQQALDVGCGTGILAMAIVRLWKNSRCLASDIDKESVRVAAANARKNQLRDKITCLHAIGYRHPTIGQARPYPLIVANILAKPLCLLAKDLNKHLANGGYTIASGLLDWQQNQVVAAYRTQGLHLVKVFKIGCWHTLVFRKGTSKNPFIGMRG